MEIVKTGMAGTMESSDIHVLIEPNGESGIVIYLHSSVEKQFGAQIRKMITETLEVLNVSHAIVRANDKGALDCTIKARVISAVYRAAGIEKNFDWGELDKWSV